MHRRALHVRLAQFGEGLVLPDLGFGFVARLLLGVVADHRDGLGHVADLVAAVCTGDDHIEMAFGHLVHRAIQPGHRPRYAEERKSARPDQHQNDGAAEPERHLTGAPHLVADIRRTFRHRLLRDRHRGAQQFGDCIGGRDGLLPADLVLQEVGFDDFIGQGDDLSHQRTERIDRILQWLVLRQIARLLQGLG